MRNPLKHILFAIALLVPLMSPAASIRIRLDAPNKIEVGQQFHIEIDADGVMPMQQPVGGCMVSYFLMNMTNGKGHGTYTLHARVPGTYKFTAVADGVRSNTISYKIVDSSGQGAAPVPSSSPGPDNKPDKVVNTSSGPKFIGKGDGNLFMRASISKTKVYEQEALVYTVKLYSTYHTIKFIGATTSPKFEGFTVEESKATDKQLHFENYNGKEYASAVIARYIIFPQMTGTLKIIGNTYTVSVEERIMYQDSYWGSMSYGQPLQLNVTPNDLSVEVLPLPQPKPANFSGGVGSFNLTSQLSSNQLKTNQPTVVTYTVSGNGNLKYVQLPDLATIYPSQIVVSSPQTDVKTTVDASSVQGSIKYEYTITPTEEGDFTLPPVSLVYFNPETGNYETSTTQSYNVRVGKGNASDKSQKKETLQFNPSLMTIGNLEMSHRPYITRFSYWLFYIVPVLLLAFAMIIYRRQLKLAADVEGLKARRAKRLANKWLKKARAAMKKNDRDEFNDALLMALWGYLGDKLKIKPSDLSRKNVAEILSAHGVGEQAINHLIALIDEVEFGKYSSVQSGADMNQLLTNASGILSELEDSFTEVKNTKKEDNDED